jgi:glyoxylase-like metal-dependent hydrolase (beta-lactamase superfamily II)
MHRIEHGIFYDNSYLGVTLGGLVFAHGTILVDAPLRAEDARSWRSTLLNQRGGTNRLLINLDAHPDRTLGARNLDATVLAHQKTAAVFRNRSTIFKGQNVETGSAWESYSDAIGMRWAVPDITFTLTMSLHWGGPEVILEHHPGPSAGSIWVNIPDEHVVFVGDTVVVDQPPFLANSDLTAWLESLDLLQNSYRDYVIVGGRGGPISGNALVVLQRHLKNVSKGIERLFKRSAPPDATEDLIPALLADFTFPAERQEKYTQRLRNGLYQYYARRYRPTNSNDLSPLEDSET